jgi:hypothetical protein
LKRQEEKERLGGIEEAYRIRDFSYLREAMENEILVEAYEKMLDNYVFLTNDRRRLEEANHVFEVIKTINE